MEEYSALRREDFESDEYSETRSDAWQQRLMADDTAISELVPSYERYLATATDLQPNTRERYGREVRLFAGKAGGRL